MYGRVEWYDADGILHAVSTATRDEHTRVCRRLRRQARTIRKATQISRLA